MPVFLLDFLADNYVVYAYLWIWVFCKKKDCENIRNATVIYFISLEATCLCPDIRANAIFLAIFFLACVELPLHKPRGLIRARAMI